NERLFSPTEEDQLMSVFGLTAENLSLVLDSCCYVFEQAAFQNVGPEPLYDQLLQAGLDEAHAKTIGRLWASERAEFIGKLKTRSIGSCALVDTDHHLNLLVGESNLSRLQDPTALFEFTTTTPGGEQLTEKTVVEFSHAELFDFFTQLERVQVQLDSLSA
ncbi:COMMD10, partial [Symbiodinium microadriaticum]